MIFIIRLYKHKRGIQMGALENGKYKERNQALSQRVEELTQENRALRDALDAAEEANRAKSRFLSSMSHDIRTPMNAIMGMTAIGLSHIDEKARVQDCLDKIHTASAHLMSLVNDVLDMSRIDSGRMTISQERFSLADLTHDVAVIVRPQAEQKRQSLRFEIGEIREESLTGDPLRLRQILVNIIGNAVKYTQEGGSIRVCFGQRPAREEGAVWLAFLCEDNGIGMSQEFLERIFLPFERVRSSTVERIEGTGLGMSIVKNLVDAMGGQIRVESEEGAGSRFTVALPLPVARQERERALPAGASVLIAERREDRAVQMETCLRSGGLRPVRLEGGMEAVTYLTEAKYEDRMPCALLLGQELEDMQPLAAAAYVRQLAGREFPILLVSEEDWAQIEYRAVRDGVNAFVPCPLFGSRLLDTLAHLIGDSGENADATGPRDGDYSAYRALLVEDNELNREIGVELLSMTGIQVETAENGLDAVEKFAAAPAGWYDVIFMDIQMPVMDGYEAVRNIRRMDRPDAGEVWIVAMTANAFVEDVRLSRESGMNEHVSKPVDLERLQDVLCRRLS